MTMVKKSLYYRTVNLTYCLNYDAMNDDDVRLKNRPPNKFKLTGFLLSAYFVSKVFPQILP